MIRALLVAFFLLPAAASAQQVSFSSVAVGNVAAGPGINGAIHSPRGSGPFPTILLAHSCAGMNRHTDFWSRLMTGWGFLVMTFDSFNPRGEGAVCTKPGTITPNMRVADVAGALDFLSTRPDVAKGRIGIIGHSHGGSTTIRALQKGFDLGARGLRGGVSYYPFCSPSFDREVALPMLLLAGDKDDWTPADRCRQLVSSATQPQLIDAVYYPNARHSFDANAPERTVPGAPGKTHRLVYDPVAAPDAEARTRAFFERILR